MSIKSRIERLERVFRSESVPTYHCFPIIEGGDDFISCKNCVVIDAPLTAVRAMRLLLEREDERRLLLNKHGAVSAKEAAKILGGEAALVYFRHVQATSNDRGEMLHRMNLNAA